MRRWGLWSLVIALGGCCSSAPVALRPASPSAPATSIELPFTLPIVPDLNGESLQKPVKRQVAGPEGRAFRKLTEADCLQLAVGQASLANLLDDENRVPVKPGSEGSAADRLRQSFRYYAALEQRNRAASEALERYFQLADAEARTDLLRQAFPIIDPLATKAREAKTQNIRYPLDPVDLDRQRSQLVSQLEQAELGSRLLNLDLKRRLGLPYAPGDERLWPTGDFAINSESTDPDEAVIAALADRPELRGLRALHKGLTPDVLPDVRDLLRLSPTPPSSPALALAMAMRRILHRNTGPDPAVMAELEVRRNQLADLIADRERAIEDEARAAAMIVNSQHIRASLARERFLGWDEKLTDAMKKQEAKQPGAEFLEPQVRLEWLKAKSEVVAEVAAWHQARARLRAAMGWLVWEAVGKDDKPIPKR